MSIRKVQKPGAVWNWETSQNDGIKVVFSMKMFATMVEKVYANPACCACAGDLTVAAADRQTRGMRGLEVSLRVRSLDVFLGVTTPCAQNKAPPLLWASLPPSFCLRTQIQRDLFSPVSVPPQKNGVRSYGMSPIFSGIPLFPTQRKGGRRKQLPTQHLRRQQQKKRSHPMGPAFQSQRLFGPKRR